MASKKSDYYVQRATQARTMADKAKDPCARKAHLEMAQQYDMAVHGERKVLGIVERG